MSTVFLREKQLLKGRFAAVYLVVVVLFGVLVINLIDLQVVEGNENLFLSSTIKTSETIIRAPRGLIYDRDGNLLVVNRPAFRLVIDLHQLEKDKEEMVIGLLSQILQIDQEDLSEDFHSKVYTEGGERVSLSQVTLLNNVERDKIISIYSRIEELPGVFIEVATSRDYLEGEMFSHVIGYVREVSEKDLEAGDYVVGDIIGATGIEQYYDSILRGTNGRRVVETDRDETAIRELIPIEATAGKSIKISLDSSMQRKLTEVLEAGIERNNADGGAAIILDVTTGEIVSLVSLPSFDPNEIVSGLSFSEYLALSSDTTLPLYNRAISMAQPAGSTYKTIVGSVGLQEGSITTSTILESEGCMDLGSGYEFCEVGKVPFGKLDVLNAYERSSNIFFAKTMMRYGIGKFNEYADDFGLGQNTGIDLYGEQAGVVPSYEVKRTLQGEEWYLGDTCNTAIGQGLVRVTPLQMVSWIAAIANGGTYYKPHLAVAVLDGEGNEIQIFNPEVVHTLPIDKSNLDVVKAGMHRVVNGSWGSAYPLRGLKSDPAAKTGSAEAWRKVNGVYEKQGHSWITGFFPYNNPRYAFVVYIEYGGWGFKSAEVMRDFLQWYDSEYSQ
jgi:penicillin-binding protein 2